MYNSAGLVTIAEVSVTTDNGYTGEGVDQWFCIQDPWNADAEITVTY